MTRYVVLKREGENDCWQVVDRVEAKSDRDAVKQVAKANGRYVAVAARSFKAVDITINTAPTVKIKAA